MVDHRADDDHGFKVFAESGREGGRSLGELWQDAKDWLFARPLVDAPRQRRRYPSDGSPETSRSGLRRTAVIVSLIWALALGAYGIGYYLRLEGLEGGTRMLPTLDLLFFAFAVAGPIAMLWVVVNMLDRAERLTQSIDGQSESALALAATLANLNDSVDALSAGTTGRLEQACDRMEREAAASVAALDSNLRDASGRLDSALIDSVTMLHEQMLARDKEREARIERQRSAMETRLDEDARRLALAIETEVQALRETKELLTQKIEASFAETHSRLDDRIADVFARQESGLSETGKRVERALDGFAGQLAETQDAQTRFLRTGLAEPIGDISARLAETRKSIAANPPATAEALADLLGKSAQSMVRTERQAIERALERIQILDERTSRMLDTIDRTSRLNPLMDAPDAPAKPAGLQLVTQTPGDNTLPFADLPRSAERAALNWTAVLHALSGTETRPGNRHVIERALADPDVAAVMALTAQVTAELAEDKVHVEDLALEHAPSALWARYGQGERGGDVLELAGTSDDVTEAIVRARLRAQPAFRALALRQVRSYAALIARAVDEIGADQRLVELAETNAGRCFMLLGGLTGAFGGTTMSAQGS